MKIKNFLLFAIIITSATASRSQEAQRDSMASEARHCVWQVSFLPFFGTNGFSSGDISNDFSFNILGGYSRATAYLEIGSLANINHEYANGVQIAGLANVTGGSTSGFRAAGLCNIAGANHTGMQAAGLANINGGKTMGLQTAGLVNLNSHAEGSTVAGLANISDTTSAVMLAGLCNIARSGQPLQVAGIMNLADESYLQISGFFNAARHSKGLQLAILNFADSSSGVPLGVFSFIESGIHQVEISGDEAFYTNLSFRTGVKRFYNQISVGMQPGDGDLLWQIGYGIGSSVGITEKIAAEINLSTHHVSMGPLRLVLSQLCRVNPALEYRFSEMVGVVAGPTFNVYFSENERWYRIDRLNGWVGAKIAVRFF